VKPLVVVNEIGESCDNLFTFADNIAEQVLSEVSSNQMTVSKTIYYLVNLDYEFRAG